MFTGRAAKPVELHLLNGNKRHLTKEMIADRQEHERSLSSGQKEYKPNKQVRKDPVALDMFKKLKKLYKDLEYVEGMDEMIINRYCTLTSESVTLEQLLVLMRADIDLCKNADERIQLYHAISGIVGKLTRTREMLIKIEDRLFLNPAARVRNIPKKPPKRTTDPHANMFGD